MREYIYNSCMKRETKPHYVLTLLVWMEKKSLWTCCESECLSSIIFFQWNVPNPWSAFVSNQWEKRMDTIIVRANTQTPVDNESSFPFRPEFHSWFWEKKLKNLKKPNSKLERNVFNKFCEFCAENKFYLKLSNIWICILRLNGRYKRVIVFCISNTRISCGIFSLTVLLSMIWVLRIKASMNALLEGIPFHHCQTCLSHP